MFLGEYLWARSGPLHGSESSYGQSTDLNYISWAISTIRAHSSVPDPISQGPIDSGQRDRGYTSSQTLLSMEDRPDFPYWGTTGFSRTPNTPRIPHLWNPKYISQNTIYTDGSNIKGNPRLRALVTHVPIRSTIYTDAGGIDETRTIMRS